MRYFVLALVVMCTHSYACGVKDYDCIKEQYNQSKKATYGYDNKYQTGYNYNEKVIVKGQYDSSPVELDGRYNHNIRVYANGTNINSGTGTASIVNIRPSAYHNRVTVNATGTIRQSASSKASYDTCVALVCNRSSSGQGVIVNIRNAQVTNTVK